MKERGLPMSAVQSVKVEISAVIGKSVIPMHQLLRMGRGAVIELDANQNDEVWLLANNRPVARGEIHIDGEKISISVTRTLPAFE